MHTMWLLLLLAVSVSSKVGKHHRNHNVHCFSSEALLEESSDIFLQQYLGHKIDWNQYNPVNLVKVVDEAERNMTRRHRRSSHKRCSDFLSKEKESDKLNLRSISPWSYSIDIDENRYPQRLAFAKCLCKNCVHASGHINGALNSVPVNQSMLVLRKKECPHRQDPGKKYYTFSLEYQSVPVACTCARPLYS